jgi:hypothetical protein
LTLEVLEDRTLLSGNVTAGLTGAGTGVLSLFGDTGDNQILIVPEPISPTRNIIVMGNPGSGTTVNNAPFATFDLSTIRDIFVTLQSGSNQLHIYGPLPSASGISGSLNVTTGTGKNLLAMGNVLVNTLHYTSLGPGDTTASLVNVTAGTANLTTGTGADTYYVMGSTINALAINTGTGPANDFVRVGGSSMLGSVSVVAGDGDQNIGINDSTIMTGVTVVVGTHSSNVDVSRNTIQGVATINVGVGGQNNQNVSVNDNIFLKGDLNLTVGNSQTSNSATSVAVVRDKFTSGNANVSVGNNADSVVVDTLLVNSSQGLGGNLTAKIGTNAHTTTLSNITTSIPNGGSIDFTIGTGAATVNLAALTTGSNLRVDGSMDNGNTVTVWNLRTFAIGNNFTMTTGNGPINMGMQALTVKNNMAVTLGNGFNMVNANSVRSGSGFINGGGNPGSIFRGKNDPMSSGFTVFGFGSYPP